MRVFTNNQFDGHYPVGTAAVVVAEDAVKAAELLNTNLSILGLPEQARPETMNELSLTGPVCRILCDGNY